MQSLQMRVIVGVSAVFFLPDRKWLTGSSFQTLTKCCLTNLRLIEFYPYDVVKMLSNLCAFVFPNVSLMQLCKCSAKV